MYPIHEPICWDGHLVLKYIACHCTCYLKKILFHLFFYKFESVVLQILILVKVHHHGIIMFPSIWLIWCFFLQSYFPEKERPIWNLSYVCLSILFIVKKFRLRRLGFHKISTFPSVSSCTQLEHMRLLELLQQWFFYVHSLVVHARMEIHFYVMRHDWNLTSLCQCLDKYVANFKWRWR